MTLKELFTHFFNGIEPGRTIKCGRWRATDKVLWWEWGELGRSATMAVRSNGHVICRCNRPNKRIMAPTAWETTKGKFRCVAQAFPDQVVFSTAIKMPPALPGKPWGSGSLDVIRTIVTTGEGHTRLHFIIARACHLLPDSQPAILAQYNRMCLMADVEPLFQTAKELADWYVAADQLIG